MKHPEEPAEIPGDDELGAPQWTARKLSVDSEEGLIALEDADDRDGRRQLRCKARQQLRLLPQRRADLGPSGHADDP